MAKVILSALLESLLGKLSGSVFQQSLGGLQIRSLVKPADRRAPTQQERRGAWAFATATYATMSQANRDTWIGATGITPTGRLLFAKSNSLISLATLPIILAYTGGGLLTNPGLTITELDTDAIQLSFSNYGATVPANSTILVYATRPLASATTQISIPEYVFLTQRPAGTYGSAAFDITVPYIARYGSVPFQSVIGFRAIIINYTTGDFSDFNKAQGSVTLP